MAVQVNPITQSLPATTAIQDPATRRFAQAVEDALRALRSEEGAVESLKKAADAMNNAVAGGTPPSIAQWLFSSELYQKLTTEIARVDTQAKQDVLDEALARSQAIQEIQAALAEIESTSAYDPATTYQIGDLVTYDNKLYRAKAETTGNLPTNTTYWDKVGDYATIGGVVAAHTLQLSEIESDITDIGGDLAAEITARDALATQLRGTYTGTDVAMVSQGLLYSERRARVAADGVTVSNLNALRAQVGVTEAGTLTEGFILNEQTIRNTNDLAIVSAVNTALAQITGVSTSISQSGENLIANWTTAQADKWSQIESEVLTSGGQTIRAALLQESQTRANADGSLGAQWTLKTDINGYISGFGFASTANNATPTSEFIIRADKFAVVMPGYGEYVPFAIGDFGPSMFGDGGFSVPVSRLVNQAAQPTSFLETFESGSVAQWINHDGSGELSVVSVVDSLTGGKVLRIGNNSGNDQAWLIHKQNIPFDPSALYRIKFRVRRTAGTGGVHLGLAGVAADGVTWVNTSGANSTSSQHYVAAVNQNPGASWTEYVGYVKGTAATGQAGTNPSVTTPLKLHQNVKYIRPLILVNYPNAAGTTEVDYCSIELMTDAMSWDAVAGAGKDAIVNTLADIASDSKLTPAEKKITKKEWDGLVAEKSGINSQASSFNITTENTNYNNAYNTLNSYITPLLSSLTTTSNIVGTTFRSNFSSFYTARQALLNKISAEAAKRADWAAISGAGKPENGATVGAPAGTLVAGVPAANVATAVTDFNASNNRNGAAITAPTILTDGTAVDHVAQKDGSVDISFEWRWSGNEGDIDGFLVYARPSTSSTPYTLGTTPAEETVYTVPANKRAFVLFGVAADKYYTFGVQAYRAVDKAINPAGVIKSTLVKATGSGENPYRPSSTVAFTGDVTGTISGTSASTLVSTASTALSNANAAQTAANTANAALADIASDSKLTPAEKKITKKEWDGIVAEKAGINAQATALGVTAENTAYNNAYNTLNSYITPLLSSLTTTSGIVGSTFRSKFSSFYTARQALLNKISAVAATKADWGSVTNKTGFASITQITPSNVTTYIANAAIGNAQIANASITNAKIANATILAANIADGNITNAKIANAAITNAKIGNAAVDTLQIKGEAVTIPVHAYTSADLTLNSVDAYVDIQTAYVNPEGGSVSVVATFQTTRGRTHARVLSPSGSVLCSISDTSGCISLSAKSTLAGTYKLQAARSTPVNEASAIVAQRSLLLIGSKR